MIGMHSRDNVVVQQTDMKSHDNLATKQMVLAVMIRTMYITLSNARPDFSVEGLSEQEK